MAKMIFVNLPVTDLDRSIAFYEGIGFTKNPQFSNEVAASMVWSDTIYVMLLTHDFWKTFTTKTIPDAHVSAQMALCVTFDSRAEVDAITEAAGKHGGKADNSPPQDHGFMYQRSFEDPDGHGWEPVWMDPAVASGEKQPDHVSA